MCDRSANHHTAIPSIKQDPLSNSRINSTFEFTQYTYHIGKPRGLTKLTATRDSLLVSNSFTTIPF